MAGWQAVLRLPSWGFQEVTRGIGGGRKESMHRSGLQLRRRPRSPFGPLLTRLKPKGQLLLWGEHLRGRPFTPPRGAAHPCDKGWGGGIRHLAGRVRSSTACTRAALSTAADKSGACAAARRCGCVFTRSLLGPPLRRLGLAGGCRPAGWQGVQQNRACRKHRHRLAGMVCHCCLVLAACMRVAWVGALHPNGPKHETVPCYRGGMHSGRTHTGCLTID
jgi:hypothetical protein